MMQSQTDNMLQLLTLFDLEVETTTWLCQWETTFATASGNLLSSLTASCQGVDSLHLLAWSTENPGSQTESSRPTDKRSCFVQTCQPDKIRLVPCTPDFGVALYAYDGNTNCLAMRDSMNAAVTITAIFVTVIHEIIAFRPLYMVRHC